MKVKKELTVAVVFVAILLTIGFLFPQTIGLAAGGFDSERVLEQFNFYTVGIGYLIAILFFIFGMMWISREGTYGDGVLFASQGEFPSLPIFKQFSMIRLTLLFLIISLILGVFVLNTQQTSFTGFRVLEHQFTPMGSVTYSALLIPISENAGAALITAFFLFFLTLLAKKINMDRTSFLLVAWFMIPAVVGFYGLANHVLRYGSSEFNLTVVLIFWAIIGLLTVATGSFIPGVVLHLVNNLLFDLKRFFDNEAIMAVFVGVIIALILLFVYLTFIRKPGGSISQKN